MVVTVGLVTNIAFGLLAFWLIWRQVAPIIGTRRISAEKTAEALASGLITVVDVRTAEEYFRGHIPQSESIPLAEIRQRCQQLDRTKPIVLVCRSGYRAMQAFHILKRRGFRNHAVVSGGMIAWESMRSRQYRELSQGGRDMMVGDDSHEPSL